MSVNLYKKLDI